MGGEPLRTRFDAEHVDQSLSDFRWISVGGVGIGPVELLEPNPQLRGKTLSRSCGGGRSPFDLNQHGGNVLAVGPHEATAARR